MPDEFGTHEAMLSLKCGKALWAVRIHELRQRDGCRGRGEKAQIAPMKRNQYQYWAPGLSTSVRRQYLHLFSIALEYMSVQGVQFQHAT
jgi:hypothetical protein